MQISIQDKLKAFFKLFISFSYWINGACLAFVIWQTIQCIAKYIDKPQGTAISMKKSANLPFPGITICGSFGKDEEGDEMGLNETYLQNVCGLSYDDYYWGQYSSSNCSDPKELYEAIVFKPEDVIETIEFEYWTKSEGTLYNIHEFNDWYHNDDSKFGRCFTLAPSHEYSQHGIKLINLKHNLNSNVFIHTPGMFIKGNEQANTYVEKGKRYQIDIRYEIRELIDYGGDPCNTDKNYQLDVCYAKETEKRSLTTVGCITPYGSNKTNICTDVNNGKVALDIYRNFSFSDSMNYEECYYPCSYLIVSSKNPAIYSSNSSLGKVTLYFPQLIQETKTQYTYSWLSLIAEIGGYVGLFLGISINQITNLFDIRRIPAQ